jgi:NRPS condensation-like uncharacterized protein
MKFLHQSVPLLKMIIFIWICYHVGIIIGSIVSFILHKLHMCLVDKLFKLEPLTPGDMNFIWTDDHERYNLVTFLIFEDFEPEKIKNLLIEKGIKNFRKLRSRVVFKFFEWYWEERNIDEAIERIEIIKNNDKFRFDSHDDLLAYAYKEIGQRIDIINEMPFKFVIIQNEKSKFKNVLMIKFDHSFTDGLGFIGLICALADNYSIDLFPRTNFKQKGFLDYLVLLCSIPYFIISIFYRNLITLSTGASPFKLSGNKKNTGQPQIQISKIYDFNIISKICKSLKVTFNDLMMSIISSSCTKFCLEHKFELPKSLSAVVPVGHRKIPKTFKDIKILNDSTAVGCKIDLISDPIKECHIINNEFKNNLRNIPFITLTKLLSDLIFKFFPDYLSKKIVRSASRSFDFTISNVPGPKNALYYADGKISEMMAFTSPGYISSFVGVFSYNGTFRFLFCFDEILGINVTEFKNYVEREIEYVLANTEIKAS